MGHLEELVSLTQKLISFKTTADRPETLADSINYISDFFNDSPVPIKRFERNQKPSLLITPDDKIPEILLNGHVDVVPAKDDQFSPIFKDGRIYGRGALDMKGGLAILMVLMKNLAQEKSNLNVGLSVVSDEEIGGKDGTGLMVEQGIKPKFFLAAEPTDLQIGNEARGVVWLKIKASGRSAHASMPWLGENANLKLLTALKKVAETYPNPSIEQWQTTYNISVISGGDSINKVPDVAEAKLDIRYVPQEKPEEIIQKIKSLCEGCEVETLMSEPAVVADTTNPYLVKLQQSLKKNGIEPRFLKKYAASDARYFSALKIPAVVFGPSGQGQHADEEWVDLKSLDQTYKILYDFVKL